MSFIRPRMHRNSLCTKLFAEQCHLKDIGVVATASISECSNFIDVYGEFGQVHFQHSDTKIRGWMRFSVVFLRMISERAARWICFHSAPGTQQTMARSSAANTL